MENRLRKKQDIEAYEEGARDTKLQVRREEERIKVSMEKYR